MSLALTEKSTLNCLHQGSVKLTSKQSKLKVAGTNVLVAGDLTGASISGCSTTPDPNTATLKCLLILTAIGGVSSKLKVSGAGVLLETIQGQTTGTLGGTPQTWSVKSAGQSKLKAP